MRRVGACGNCKCRVIVLGSKDQSKMSALPNDTYIVSECSAYVN